MMNVLLVEDNEGDVILMQEAFNENQIEGQLLVARSDTEAKEMIISNLPTLILTDMNIPQVGGLEVLNFVKTNDKYRHIPVIVFSSFLPDEQLSRCYSEGANGVIIKENGYEKLKKNVENLINYWIKTVILP